MVAVRTAGLPDGSVVAVTAGKWDGAVGVWELERGVSLRTRLTGHSGPLDALALTELPDGRVVAVVGGRNGVWSWELTGSASGGRPTRLGTAAAGAGGGTRALAVASVGGRVVVVSGGRDGIVRLTDLSTGAPVGEPWRASEGPVRAMVIIPVEPGASALATAGTEAEVRLWQLPVGTPVRAPLPTAGAVRALSTVAGDVSRLVLGGAGIAVADLLAPTPLEGARGD